MNNSIKGWVYIITTKSMPRLLKVGFSRKDPTLRATELNNTGNPYPYTVEWDVLVNNPEDIEKKSHAALKQYHENKEWFKCSIELAIKAIEMSAQGNILLNINKKYTPVDQKQKNTRFLLHDGMAVDTETGLTWLRFSHGQLWRDLELHGIRKKIKWQDIESIVHEFNKIGYAGNFDWRLPSAKELENLLSPKKQLNSYAIDTSIFPENTGTTHITDYGFWTSSFTTLPKTAAVSGEFAYIVNFLTGQTTISKYKSQISKHAIKLVRGSFLLHHLD